MDTAFGTRVEQVPADVAGAIRATKTALRSRIGDVAAAFEQVEAYVAAQVAEIEATRARGGEVWPVIDYADIAAGRVSAEDLARIHRRGCLVVRGHFPIETAQAWDKALVDYVERNRFFENYRGPGDNFFGTLAASRPEIYPVYWSPSQMQARQHERMATVQSFLNRQWKFESQGVTWFDPDQDTMYPDRIRRRPPGTTSSGLGAHTDSGRWNGGCCRPTNGCSGTCSTATSPPTTPGMPRTAPRSTSTRAAPRCARCSARSRAGRRCRRCGTTRACWPQCRSRRRCPTSCCAHCSTTSPTTTCAGCRRGTCCRSTPSGIRC